MQSLGAIHEDLSRISSIFLAAPFLFFACELSVRRVLVDLAPGRAAVARTAPAAEDFASWRKTTQISVPVSLVLKMHHVFASSVGAGFLQLKHCA